MFANQDKIELSGPSALRFWRLLFADPAPADLSEAIDRYLTDTEHDPRLTPPGESVSVRALKSRDYAV